MKKTWADSSKESNSSGPVSTGKRVAICRAGSAEDFVDNALLLWKGHIKMLRRSPKYERLSVRKLVWREAHTISSQRQKKVDCTRKYKVSLQANGKKTPSMKMRKNYIIQFMKKQNIAILESIPTKWNQYQQNGINTNKTSFTQSYQRRKCSGAILYC